VHDDDSDVVVIAVMRIKVEQTVVSGQDLKIVAANKRKMFRTSAVLKSKEVNLIINYVTLVHLYCLVLA
jgi:hypothetical protein